jgi:hypothetical protein
MERSPNDGVYRVTDKIQAGSIAKAGY